MNRASRYRTASSGPGFGHQPLCRRPGPVSGSKMDCEVGCFGSPRRAVGDTLRGHWSAVMAG